MGSIVYQLTKDVPADVMKAAGLGDNYADHDHAIYPVSASGEALDILQSKLARKKYYVQMHESMMKK